MPTQYNFKFHNFAYPWSHCFIEGRNNLVGARPVSTGKKSAHRRRNYRRRRHNAARFIHSLRSPILLIAKNLAISSNSDLGLGPPSLRRSHRMHAFRPFRVSYRPFISQLERSLSKIKRSLASFQQGESEFFLHIYLYSIIRGRLSRFQRGEKDIFRGGGCI